MPVLLVKCVRDAGRRAVELLVVRPQPMREGLQPVAAGGRSQKRGRRGKGGFFGVRRDFGGEELHIAKSVLACPEWKTKREPRARGRTSCVVVSGFTAVAPWKSRYVVW